MKCKYILLLFAVLHQAHLTDVTTVPTSPHTDGTLTTVQRDAGLAQEWDDRSSSSHPFQIWSHSEGEPDEENFVRRPGFSSKRSVAVLQPYPSLPIRMDAPTCNTAISRFVSVTRTKKSFTCVIFTLCKYSRTLLGVNYADWKFIRLKLFWSIKIILQHSVIILAIGLWELFSRYLCLIMIILKHKLILNRV